MERNDGVASYFIPEQYCSPFGSYPNPLGITDQDRKEFCPVVKFPSKVDESTGKQFFDYRILDHTGSSSNVAKSSSSSSSSVVVQLVSLEEFVKAQEAIRNGMKVETVVDFTQFRDNWGWFGIGRYDENRVGLYESPLFHVQDPSEQRTVHVGMDLDGPVGTPVHAFYHGLVHSVGYNPDLGDYGHVIVIEHDLPNTTRTVFALYGHLDSFVLQNNFDVGCPIHKGQVLGYMGSFWENGGWTIPHVHFQISLKPPSIPHDMPGAVAPKNRPLALWDYPDPRYILGPLY